MAIEHRFLFFPENHIYWRPDEFGVPYEDVYYTASDGVRINAWFVPASDDAPVLVWCHGNAGNISHRLENILLLVRWGLSVFIFDYRGYGLSEGEITEDGLYQDAWGAYEYLTEELGIPASQIVPFGRSMGGPVAVDLATRASFPAVVLESTFTSLADAVKTIYPRMGLDRMLTMEFDAAEKIKRVTAPVLFLHGDSDEIIDFSLGHRLFGLANEPKAFYTIKGAKHNDTFDVGGEEYFKTFVDFVNKYAGKGDAK
jgi:fermentation-respiration switch protein FrsA (DUF1100 family)